MLATIRGLALPGFLVSGVSCERATGMATTNRRPTVATASAESPQPRPSSRSPAPAPSDLPDGCYNGRDAGVTPTDQLADLGRRCAQAMVPVLPRPFGAVLKRGERRDVPFTVTDPSKCLRAIAVGASGIEDLDLEIVDRQDRSLGADELPAAFALVDRRGPVCTASPGQYRAVITVTAGEGEIMLQVWRAQ